MLVNVSAIIHCVLCGCPHVWKPSAPPLTIVPKGAQQQAELENGFISLKFQRTENHNESKKKFVVCV